MAAREEYRKIVMNTFRQSNSRPGHVMPMRNFRFGVMRDMTHEQHNDFIDSINSLIQEGYITYEDGGPGLDVLRLTQRGYDALYNDPDRVAIAERIMEQFRDQHIDVNQIIMFRYFRLSFLPQLNPKEQDCFIDVCNQLIEAQWIDYQEANPECLRLLQAGYNYIYHKQGNLNAIIHG